MMPIVPYSCVLYPCRCNHTSESSRSTGNLDPSFFLMVDVVKDLYIESTDSTHQIDRAGHTATTQQRHLHAIHTDNQIRDLCAERD